MIPTGFIVAMAAEMTFGDYDNPTLPGTSEAEWIIVSVWGGKSEYLSLSRTGTPVATEGDAPPGLQPQATYLGILLTSVTDNTGTVSEYLLTRNLPEEVPVGGVFHPSDGYVRVHRDGDAITVTGGGRYAHVSGTWRGQPVIRDMPHPPPGSADARSWRLRAERRAWIGEYSDGRAITRPLARSRLGPHTPARKRPEATNGIAA